MRAEGRGSGTHEVFGRCEKPGIDYGSSLVLESAKKDFKQDLHQRATSNNCAR